MYPSGLRLDTNFSPLPPQSARRHGWGEHEQDDTTHIYPAPDDYNHHSLFRALSMCDTEVRSELEVDGKSFFSYGTEEEHHYEDEERRQMCMNHIEEEVEDDQGGWEIHGLRVLIPALDRAAVRLTKSWALHTWKETIDEAERSMALDSDRTIAIYKLVKLIKRKWLYSSWDTWRELVMVHRRMLGARGMARAFCRAKARITLRKRWCTWVASTKKLELIDLQDKAARFKEMQDSLVDVKRSYAVHLAFGALLSARNRRMRTTLRRWKSNVFAPPPPCPPMLVRVLKKANARRTRELAFQRWQAHTTAVKLMLANRNMKTIIMRVKLERAAAVAWVAKTRVLGHAFGLMRANMLLEKGKAEGEKRAVRELGKVASSLGCESINKLPLSGAVSTLLHASATLTKNLERETYNRQLLESQLKASIQGRREHENYQNGGTHHHDLEPTIGGGSHHSTTSSSGTGEHSAAHPERTVTRHAPADINTNLSTPNGNSMHFMSPKVRMNAVFSSSNGSSAHSNAHVHTYVTPTASASAMNNTLSNTGNRDGLIPEWMGNNWLASCATLCKPLYSNIVRLSGSTKNSLPPGVWEAARKEGLKEQCAVEWALFLQGAKEDDSGTYYMNLSSILALTQSEGIIPCDSAVVSRVFTEYACTPEHTHDYTSPFHGMPGVVAPPPAQPVLTFNLFQKSILEIMGYKLTHIDKYENKHDKLAEKDSLLREGRPLVRKSTERSASAEKITTPMYLGGMGLRRPSSAHTLRAPPGGITLPPCKPEDVKKELLACHRSVLHAIYSRCCPKYASASVADSSGAERLRLLSATGLQGILRDAGLLKEGQRRKGFGITSHQLDEMLATTLQRRPGAQGKPTGGTHVYITSVNNRPLLSFQGFVEVISAVALEGMLGLPAGCGQDSSAETTRRIAEALNRAILRDRGRFRI